MQDRRVTPLLVLMLLLGVGLVYLLIPSGADRVHDNAASPLAKRTLLTAESRAKQGRQQAMGAQRRFPAFGPAKPAPPHIPR